MLSERQVDAFKELFNSEESKIIIKEYFQIVDVAIVNQLELFCYAFFKLGVENS